MEDRFAGDEFREDFRWGHDEEIVPEHGEDDEVSVEELPGFAA